MKQGSKRRFRRVLAMALVFTMLLGMPGLAALAAETETTEQGSGSSELRLWYNKPASQSSLRGATGSSVPTTDDDIWQKNTLPIGSGDLGANVYGEIGTERITLNEKTLWTQGPTEQNPDYNGGNIIENGRNGEAMKEVETYFKEHPDAATVPGSMLSNFLGAVQGYGYFAPWGELDIAYNNLAQVTETFAATSTNQKSDQITWNGSWYTWDDQDGSHRGPAKVEINADGYFTYSFTVPAGKTGTLDLCADRTGGGGTVTVEFTQKPAGYTQAAVDAVASGGVLKSFANLVPGNYTVKGTRKSGKVDLDYIKLTCMPDTTNYTRWLSLDDAVTGVQFTAEGVTYTREFFASNPDNVIAGKLTSTGGTMDLTITLPKGGDMRTGTVAISDDTLKLAGALADNDMKYASYLKVVPTGGTVAKNSANNALVVTGATEVALFFTAATDYKMVYPVYRTGETDAQLDTRVKAVLDAAVAKGYATVRSRHLDDYHSLYGRVSVDVGQTATAKPTDELIVAYQNGTASTGEQRLLEMMLFQFGRYLTLASSRENSQLPSNLQGVWNNRRNPPWHSDYHTNVNLQMNYWPTYVTNLAECSEPLVKFVEGLRIPGRITAEVYAGAKSTPEDPEAGFMAHTQTTPFGWTCPGDAFSWGWSPAATPWLLQNVWERYEYTGDLDYMRNYIYPMLKEEARLYDKMLLNIGTEEEPVLVSAPSYSPETGPMGTAGNTYEHSLVWQLYEDACTAAEILGVDDDYITKWRFNQDHLRGPIEIGASGQIKEWYHEVEFNKDANGNSLGEGYGHRHLSHMLGMYPGDLVQTKEEWIEAARVSMNNRNDVNTGWSMAHRANVWARLRDGNHALKVLGLMIKNDKFYNNLWDTHAPFQIDGNFGYTAGVAEMLLQSNMGYIDILPALPDSWSSGSYSGLLARGNFEVGAVWADKTLKTATITSKNGGECVVAYPNIAQAKLTDAAGNLIEFTFKDNDKISFNTAKGATYKITDIPNKAATMVEGAAYRTTDDTVEVRWTAEAGTTYQVYRQIADGDILPVDQPVNEGRFVDETAYEDLGEIKYYIQAKDCELSAAINVQDNVRNVERVDDQYSVDGTNSSGTPIIYGGSWGTYNSEPANYKGTSRFIEAGNVNGQTATLTFLGTGIQVMGYRGYGTQFTMAVDGGTPQSFTVSGDNGRNKVMGEITGLKYGIHTVVFTMTKNKIDFDGFNVLGNTPPDEENPEEPDLEISTVGGVEKLWNAGDTVQFTANLEGVTWSMTPVYDQYNKGLTCRSTTHTHTALSNDGLLTAGSLTETVTVKATKGTKEATKTITISPRDAVLLVEDATTTNGTAYTFNTALTKTGTWAPWSSDEVIRHHGGSKSDGNTGATISYTFTGTGVAIYVQKNQAGGTLTVTLKKITGTTETTVESKDCSVNDSGSGVDQAEAYRKTGLENGTYSIEMTIKNGKAAFDYLEIFSTNEAAPTVDLTVLKTAVAAAAKKNEADYTATSWKTLQNALNAATGILNGTNSSVTDADVQTAANNVNTAIIGLVPKPLDPPDNLAVVQTGGTSATIKWDAVSNATSYEVTVGNGDAVNTTGTVYQITGLTPATSYTVSVKSKNSSGTSTNAATVQVQTADISAPTQPTNLSWNESTKTLTWSASTDNVAVTGYKVLVNGTQQDGVVTTTSKVLTLGGSQNTVTVIAVDAAGNESLPAKLVIAPTFTVTAVNATIEGDKNTFKAGEAVTVTATLPSGHILTGWTSADVDLTGETAETIHFSMPANDVTLTANTEAKNWQVITNLTNLTIDLPSNKTVAHGEPLTATLTAPDPYKRPSTIVVTMGGVVQQAPFVTYSSITGEINILKVTGDVVITAENAIQAPTDGDAFSTSDPFDLPSALGETTKLQAEYMERTGDGLTAPNGPGFNNKHITGFVSGTTLKLYYDAPVAGTYTMTLNYRSSRAANNQHTLGWSGDNITDVAVAPILGTLENSTAVYKTEDFDFEVNTAGPGVVTFTTSSTGDGPELDWATFTLKSSGTVANTITSITLAPTTATLYSNEDHDDHTVWLVPTVTPSTSREAVVWTSSDESVAYVEENGKVVALSSGTTTITAAAWHDKTIKAEATITVKSILSGKVSIDGTPKYNSQVSAAVNQILPDEARDTLTYQWKLDDNDISGATTRTYTPKTGDIGHQLSVEVTGAGLFEGSVESTAKTVGKATGTRVKDGDIPSHVDCSTDDVNDGKITGLDCGLAHEYKLVSGSTWTPIAAGVTEITDLAPGSYHVRHAETDTHTVGPVSATVTVLSAADSPNAHTITIPDMEGGQVTASTERALAGATVTLTVEAEDSHNYNDDLAVTDATDLEKKDDGTYTFTMPNTNVTVSASFAIKTYHIEHDLTHIDCDMTSHEVNHGSNPAPIRLTAHTGYELPETVKVYTAATADSEDPEEFVGYTYDDGVITFTAEDGVTEDLVVRGEAEPKTYQIRYQIPGLSAEGQPRQVKYGPPSAPITITLKAQSGYTLPQTVSIAMAGVPLGDDQYSYNAGTGVITIDVELINGDIIIDATGESELTLDSVIILGTPSMGQRLRAEVSPADARVTYQWRRIVDGVAISIEGATTSRYTLTADDVGHTITVRVTGTGDHSGILESAETATIDQADVIEVTSVRLDRTAANVTIKGNTLLLTETVLPENATNKMVRWSSSNESVATVSERGLVRGVGLGTATITVTTVDGSKTATCTVTVVAVTLPDKVSVNVGSTATIHSTVPDDLANKDLTWKSSDEEVATVDEDGVVTGVKAGTATITVTTGDGYTATCAVTVSVPSTSTTRPSTSASTSTTTETKEDGTKVTTTTKPDGTKVETVETPDGTKSETETKPDGTVTEKVEEPDGTKSVTETKPDGTVTAKVEEPDGTKSVTETKPDGSKTATVEQADGTKSETVVTAEGEATVTVTDADGEELAKVEIPATIPEPETKFEDLAPAPWAEEAINKVAGLELVKGIGGNKYDPIAPMTRGSLATVLHRLSQGKTDYAVTFKDVTQGRYYTEGVAWAAKANVVKGISADVFAPDDIITREQLAVMLARYAKLIGMSTKADAKALDQFADSDSTGAWAVDGVAWCVEKGILKGKGVDGLDPTAHVSRAEVAVMLDRFISLIK